MNNISAVIADSPLPKRTKGKVINFQKAKAARIDCTAVLVEYLSYLNEFRQALNNCRQSVMPDIATWHKKREALEAKLIRASRCVKKSATSGVDKLLDSFREIMESTMDDCKKLGRIVIWQIDARLFIKNNALEGFI